jgi:glutamyl-tRNA synthetase
MLGATPPRYAHVPLVVAPDGARLEKRTPGATVSSLRAAGVTAEEIVGQLAFGLGLAPSHAPASARAIAAASQVPIRWRTEPWPIPEALRRPASAPPTLGS